MQSRAEQVESGCTTLNGVSICRRLIVDGDVFELQAYGRDKAELQEEGEYLLSKGFSGLGFKCIREYVIDETSVDGVYGLWVR